MKNVIITIFLMVFVLTVCARSAELLVPSQYSTIQAAIDAAVDGDTVIVAPGTYTGTGNRDIDFLGKAITVRSTDPNDPNIVAATIIDCNGTESDPHRGFYFHSGEGANTVLEGITIINGYVSGASWPSYDSFGGGILCQNGTPMIINCIIANNRASIGGGMYNGLKNGHPTVIECKFTENLAISRGGGIFNHNANPVITNCTFIRNSSGNDGGGIFNWPGSRPVVSNCVFNENSSSRGGGMYSYSSYSTLKNCRFNGNSAGHGGAIYCSYSDPKVINCTISNNVGNYSCGGIYSSDDYSEPTLTNCIVWGNSARSSVDRWVQISGGLPFANYCCIQGGWPGLGNIDSDPCFVDAANGDYHLLLVSPCINAGDPNYVPGPNETDLDGLPRVIGARIDMGAYEFNHQPVAVAGPNQTVFAWIDGFADVNLDGSASFDDDNDVLDYYWSWTINDSNYEANGVNPTIELPVGKHTIELVVDDGIDLSEPDYCTITVIKAVRGKLTITPRVIETKSRGRWILAMLSVPPVPGEKVNKNEPLRLYPGGIEAKYQHFYKYGRSRCAPTFAFAFFDKRQVIDALGTGRFKVSVVGRFLSGRFFYGSDTIRIIAPPPHRH